MIRHCIWRGAFALGFATMSLAAQQPAAAPRIPTIASAASPSPEADGRTIRLNVEVADKSGAPVAGLAQGDFTLLDNGATRPIVGFRVISRAAEPVQAFLVIDAVNARFDTVAYEREQAEKFFRSNGGRLPVPFTVGFLTDKGIEVQQGSSRDGNAQAQAIEANAPGLREVTRAAGFWGADERLEKSIQGIQQVIELAARQPGRKLVLWASPGWPLLSGPRMDLGTRQEEQIFSDVVAYSTAMREGNVTLYSINPLGPGEPLVQENYYQSFLKGIAKPSQTDLADLSVQVLAMQSGGQVLNSTDIGKSIERCLRDTESWYELTFEAARPEHANEYHHTEVRVSKPGVAVRTRDGYYAQQ